MRDDADDDNPGRPVLAQLHLVTPDADVFYYFDEPDAVARCAKLTERMGDWEMHMHEHARQLMESWRVMSAQSPLTMAETVIVYVEKKHARPA